MVISGNEKQTNKPKKQVFLNANGTSLNTRVMIWWGELLVLHQGTQALITVSGASFVFLIFFFAKTLVPLGSTAVQTTE